MKFYTCINCQSTFDSLLKMKKHSQREHTVEEEPKSPARKAAKTLVTEETSTPEGQQSDSINGTNNEHTYIRETLIAAMQTIRNS